MRRAIHTITAPADEARAGLFAVNDTLARIRAALLDSVAVTRATLESQSEAIAQIADMVAARLFHGHSLLAFGNGGSAADAEHLCAELTGRFRAERKPLPAIALTACSAELTAIANDYGYAEVFARLVTAHGRQGDVAVAISTSGDSENVVRGAIKARARGLATVGLIGRGGGRLSKLVDIAVVVPAHDTARIQEAHSAVIHAICEVVDEALRV